MTSKEAVARYQEIYREMPDLPTPEQTAELVKLIDLMTPEDQYAMVTWHLNQMVDEFIEVFTGPVN